MGRPNKTPQNCYTLLVQSDLHKALSETQANTQKILWNTVACLETFEVDLWNLSILPSYKAEVQEWLHVRVFTAYEDESV